jgi:uroporphyrinogen decarboxylase
MNGYERCKSAIGWQKTDCIPVVPQNTVMAISRSGYGMIECLKNPVKLANAVLEAQLEYGYDGILLGPDSVILAEALGCETQYLGDDSPGVVGHIIQNIEDVDNLKPIDLLKNKRVNVWLDATRLILEKTKGKVYVICRADQGAFSLATQLRGAENMMLDLVMNVDPARTARLLDFCNLVHIQFARMVKATGAHATTCGDAYCGPGLIGPDLYKMFAFPYQKRAVESIETEIGIPYSIHICGKTAAIHEAWSKTGASVFEVDHLTDMVSLRKHTFRKTCLLGNIDTTLLCSGTTSEVREACNVLLNSIDPSTGFILSSGCSMSANTDPDNVHAMVEAARKHKH